MKKLNQRFTFNADASKVYDYLMGTEAERPREFELTDGNFACACRLLTSSNNNFLYSIIFYLFVTDGHKVTYNGDENWLVCGKEIAEMTLAQRVKNESEAYLFIEDDPQVWHYYEKGKWELPMRVGTWFVLEIWKNFIDGWSLPQNNNSSISIGGNVTNGIVISGNSNVINVHQNTKPSEEQSE